MYRFVVREVWSDCLSTVAGSAARVKTVEFELVDEFVCLLCLEDKSRLRSQPRQSS